ncbi:MAG: HEAT repeat domain-containing protein [Armatimonadetes bacterium]|nr:HEAT repeat domain-containing protein [Armatimonadota bacterium]
MITALALAVIGRVQAGFPVGSYRPDVSKAPVKSRGALDAYFGRSLLRVQSDGRFFLCGRRQQGYWRQVGEQTVCVYDGFFMISSSQPTEDLKKKWPKSNLEGLVLRRGPNGTLILNDWGRVMGPVIFRPMPKRTIPELIVTSHSEGDSILKAEEEAFYALRDRMEAEWPQVLSFINDPKQSAAMRTWAAIMLDVKDPKGIEAMAQLIFDLKPTNVKNRDQSIRRSLAWRIADNPTEKSADLLIEATRKGLLTPTNVAPALAKLGPKADIPLLISWLTTTRQRDNEAALEALTVLGGDEALSQARTLASSPEEGVQLAANGLIARFSKDAAERKAAIAKVARWLYSSNFVVGCNAVRALGASKSPDALPFLAAVLLSDASGIVRRDAATALGDLGDPRAVPALIEAKLRESGDGKNLFEEAQVWRAAAEALLKLSRSKGSG